jgi:hypothetical protein
VTPEIPASETLLPLLMAHPHKGTAMWTVGVTSGPGQPLTPHSFPAAEHAKMRAQAIAQAIDLEATAARVGSAIIVTTDPAAWSCAVLPRIHLIVADHRLPALDVDDRIVVAPNGSLVICKPADAERMLSEVNQPVLVLNVGSVPYLPWDPA